MSPARELECWVHHFEFPPRLLAVGGVINVSVFLLPDPPKVVKGWTLRVCESREEERGGSAHALTRARAHTRTARPEGEELERDQQSAATPTLSALAMAVNATPNKLRLRVPAHVIVDADPRVAWWDPASRSWLDDGVTEIAFDSSSRILSFHSLPLTHLALVQPRARDLPILRWNVTPTSDSSARVVIKGSRMTVAIDVGEDGGVELVEPARPELLDLIGKRMSPGLLMHVRGHREGGWGVQAAAHATATLCSACRSAG